MAWRTRASVNGAWSLRMDSSRCALDLSLMMLYGRPRQELLAAGDGELPDHVDRPAGQREDRGGLGVVERELGGGGLGLGAPVILVAGE